MCNFCEISSRDDLFNKKHFIKGAVEKCSALDLLQSTSQNNKEYEWSISPRNGNLVIKAKDYEDIYSFKINYCPICGKKINEDTIFWKKEYKKFHPMQPKV